MRILTGFLKKSSEKRLRRPFSTSDIVVTRCPKAFEMQCGRPALTAGEPGYLIRLRVTQPLRFVVSKAAKTSKYSTLVPEVFLPRLAKMTCS